MSYVEAAASRVALVAGEASGDFLGGGLIRAMRGIWPDAHFAGVAGEHMRAAGCRPLAGSEELSVMGLSEVVSHLPRLLRLRRRLVRTWLADPPDIFIGIDAPEFNLAIERRLRRRGVLTVHYVSPSVWAWRRGRIRGIARAVDLMLTLFPFETPFYREHGVPVRCVGHPLADEIAPVTDVGPLRRALGLPQSAPVVALLPGSRLGEVTRLALPFAETVRWLRQRLPEARFAAAMATPQVHAAFAQALQAVGVEAGVKLVPGRAREVMGAADAVLLASGTASLEALLLGRPMAVAYRVAPLSAWIARRLHLIKVRHFSLPNLLSMHAGGSAPVDEFIQEAACAERMGPALYELLTSPGRRRAQIEAFGAIHDDLRRDASRQAARAVADRLQARRA